MNRAGIYQGEWRWQGTSARLTLDLPEGSLFADLRGTWSLGDLATHLDGFSRTRLAESFARPGTSINCALGLPDGRRLQLVGAFTGEDAAEGTLLEGGAASDDSASEEPSDPGPGLIPAFQPIVSLVNGRAVGFEALARWQAERPGGDVPSGRFEDDSLAPNMLFRAAEALSLWQAETGDRTLFVQVNLTARDLDHAHLPHIVEEIIRGHGLAPGTLKLELTEHAPLRDSMSALNRVHELKSAGAGIVLDDFGTGHSSFTWLADLPADGVKVDSTLIARLGDRRTEIILDAITRLASQLGMTSTAEGVENLDDRGHLAALGFDQVQGFAFGRPMTSEAVLDLLLGPEDA